MPRYVLQGGGGVPGDLQHVVGVQVSPSFMWDHVAGPMAGGAYLTGTFTKPLERQVDEMRRLDRLEREGRATIMVSGKA